MSDPSFDHFEALRLRTRRHRARQRDEEDRLEEARVLTGYLEDSTLRFRMVVGAGGTMLGSEAAARVRRALEEYVEELLESVEGAR